MANVKNDKSRSYRVCNIAVLTALTGLVGFTSTKNWNTVFSPRSFQYVEQHEVLIASSRIESIPTFQKCSSTTLGSLLEAAQQGDLEEVQDLVRCGVDPNAEAVWRQELPNHDVMQLLAHPLHAAAWNKHAEIVQVLIDAGADVNALNEWGFSPLMAASEVGAVQSADFLISAGADVNLVTDSHHETALTIAAEYGRTEVVELLVCSDVDKAHKRIDGLTALDLAIRENHSSVVQLLQPE